MPEVLAWILGLLAFIVVLMISVGLHEGGHMGVAKLFKLSVPRFFVGFGPTLWSVKTKKTEYGIKAIPLGGFVLIEDESQPEDADERNLLSHVSPWKRMLVFLAGPAVNIVLGTAILIGVLMAVPVLTPGTSIESVNNCAQAAESGSSCTAEAAGILPGDTVKKIDGKAINVSNDFAPQLDGKESVVVEVERNGEILTIPTDLTDSKLGINLASTEVYRSAGQAFSTIGEIFVLNIEALADLPSHLPNVVASIFGADKDPESPSSVIAVGKSYGDVSADTQIAPMDKVETLLLYSGLLNIGLGFVNLLPIMPLDGGRILIAFMDTVKIAWSKLFRKIYSPVSVKTVSAMTAVTAALVFSFMALIMLSDIVLIARGDM